MSKQPAILNLDEVVPAERIVILGGKHIDVSRIPSRVILNITKNQDKLRGGGDDSFSEILKQVISICKPSFPDITEEWLGDNVDFDQLIQLIEFVLAPLKDRAGGESGKNEGSPSL
ncbi:hypothetical protein BSK49_19060 [Paenibacillus odorifer]|uniref:hypothetical protein n=1 Tax=Paenibacillus TaxID=44249 RepID=UPI00096D067A|nr:hypothetical protein [Paenibacillus odorifer]OMD85617.1 hypothetical protein BSK49_19060 [Paenibacillus odorifer]